MPDEIDLGDGVTAAFVSTLSGGEFYLKDDPMHEDPICLSAEAARMFCRFVEEKAGKE